MKRFPWKWMLALLGGLGLGLLYSWTIAPLRYVDTTPNTLRADFKDRFRSAIAASYSATHNLDRARARLALLGDADPVQELTAQAQRMLASGESFDLVQQVANLASDLKSGVASVLPSATAGSSVDTEAAPSGGSGVEAPTAPLQSPAVEETHTPMILDTPTPRPTRTPVPTAGAPFFLVAEDIVCNPNLTYGLLQVSVMDSRRHQMAGVEINISWNGGEEHFFTGLKPEIANGYADYIMQPGVTYSVRAGETGNPVPNLTAPTCPDTNGQTYTGGLKLIFQQP